MGPITATGLTTRMGSTTPTFLTIWTSPFKLSGLFGSLDLYWSLVPLGLFARPKGLVCPYRRADPGHRARLIGLVCFGR